MRLGAVAAAACLLAGTPALAQEQSEAVADGSAFHVDLPTGATFSRRAVVDFEIYQVEIGGKSIAGFYEGFAADVRSWVSNRRLSGPQTRERPDGGADYFWSRTCMPTEVHGWVMAGLTEAEDQQARAVMASVRLRACN